MQWHAEGYLTVICPKRKLIKEITTSQGLSSKLIWLRRTTVHLVVFCAVKLSIHEGLFTQMIFVLQINAIFVALKLKPAAI